MTLTINGTNAANYVKAGGVKVTPHKISTEDSGRDTQDATMYNTVIATKYELELTCRALTTAQMSALLSPLMNNDWVTVAFTDPVSGADVTKTMYCTEPDVSYLMCRNGVDYWETSTIKLVER